MRRGLVLIQNRKGQKEWGREKGQSRCISGLSLHFENMAAAAAARGGPRKEGWQRLRLAWIDGALPVSNPDSRRSTPHRMP